MNKLTLKEKISYGMGDFGNGFLFTKIFDAFMDPIAGSTIDNRQKIGKNGRLRPVMFYSSIMLAIITIVTFLTPNVSPAGKLIYAYVSYMAWVYCIHLPMCLMDH